MAAIAAGFAGVAIQIVKWVGAPIKRQFNYLCCFTTNITTLIHEAQKLDDATADLQGQIDRARDDVQVIFRQVETWLTISNQIKNETNGILNEATYVESGCLKLRARYSLSKRAKKTTDLMIEHRGQCKFDAISQPRPRSATTPVPIGLAYEFESRKQFEKDIMTTLRDGEVNMIGICGMGGLGKTVMAKRIKNRALEECVFEEVVMTVISQKADLLRIQFEIGGSLGLKLEGETSEARVQRLHARLTGTKRILLILDDVWERLVLEDLGIPTDYKGCKILLISRNIDELHGMNVEKVFKMQVLSEEDSWFLFRERAGTCMDDAKLNSLAKQVVKECMGLPIALTTVGAALKDEKNGSIWKDALRQLRQCDPDIPNFIAKVYNPRRLSYDALDSKHAKSVFLLCCLFREDDDIPLEELTYFCMGLSTFEGGIKSLEEARNRMCTLSKMLKSRSLLLDGRDEDYVRMHDVVRDVCIFIAKQEGYIGDNNCTWISSYQLPTSYRWGFPNLHLLFVINNEIRLDSAFLEGIRDLYVLFIRNYLFKSLPHSTQSLLNLTTLALYFCERLETISVVGEFVNLEILICVQCESIMELPPEIKGLNRLKLLDLTDCENLQRINRGIISNLVGLEELKMLRSFKKWEAWDIQAIEGENANAGLRELEALTNLKCLEIEINDLALAAENVHLPSTLDIFHIKIDALIYNWSTHIVPSSKKMSLYWDGETCIGDWIKMLLQRDVECLCLYGDGANIIMGLAKSEKIKWLLMGDCERVKNLITKSMDGHHPLFPSIEYLDLFSLPELEEICDGPISSTSFQNLEHLTLEGLPALKQLWKSNNCIPLVTNLTRITINGCPRLRNLEQLSIAGHDCLSQLQMLRIDECEMMEHVFLWNHEQEDENIIKIFPKLKSVRLSCLPNLTTFYQGIGGIDFPQLNTMCIRECPKFTSFVSPNHNNWGDDDDQCHYDDSSHLFCQLSKVSFEVLDTNLNPFRGHKFHAYSFNKLQDLSVYNCQGNMSLFTSSIAENLVNLRYLRIQECCEMVKVIEDDNEGEKERVVSGGEIRTTLVFPKLQNLVLKNLGKLVSFCEWKSEVELPSLERVEIEECPNMNCITLGQLTTPKLQIIKINNQDFGGAKDLNVAMQQHLAREPKEGGEENQDQRAE